MEFMKFVIIKIINFLTRRRLLYKTIGWSSFLVLVTQLLSIDIAQYYHLDFEILEAKYGQEITAVTAWLVGRFASGRDNLTMGISFILVIICLIIDYKISTKDSSKKTIWNVFFGVNQKITQNFNGNGNG